jgi:hypothetical protein
MLEEVGILGRFCEEQTSAQGEILTDLKKSCRPVRALL